MSVIRGLVACGVAAFLGLNLLAADGVVEVKTLMTERGKLLLSDDFNQPLGKETWAKRAKVLPWIWEPAYSSQAK